MLGEGAEEGHCFLPQPQLVDRTVKRLALPDHQIAPSEIEELTTAMSIDEELILQGGTGELSGQFLCYAPPFHRSEQALADRLQRLLHRPLTSQAERVEQWLDRFVAKTGLTLAPQQRAAVHSAAQCRVLVLTGGPGTGKTTTTRAIVALWKAMGKSIADTCLGVI